MHRHRSQKSRDADIWIQKNDACDGLQFKLYRPGSSKQNHCGIGLNIEKYIPISQSNAFCVSNNIPSIFSMQGYDLSIETVTENTNCTEFLKRQSAVSIFVTRQYSLVDNLLQFRVLQVRPNHQLESHE